MLETVGVGSGIGDSGLEGMALDRRSGRSSFGRWIVRSE